MLTSVNGFLTAMADNVIHSSTPGQAQYIWAKGIATPSGTAGEGPSPVPPVAPPAAPEANTVGTAARTALDTLLGLLGDPGVRLPPALCERLLTLGVELDLRLVCGPDPGTGPGPGPGAPLPVPLPDPEATVDDLLDGVAG
jgi:hypothetical protein